jgi:hypothetical protein
VAVRILAIVALVVSTARAQPKASPDGAVALREANAAAAAGDWGKVARVVYPLLNQQLTTADLAEAHRLAGLAALFQGFDDLADAQLLAWLLLEPDGHLDPSLNPPEALDFLAKVRSKHEADLLRARRPRARRSGLLSVIPVLAQVQNGQRGKAIAIGVMLGASFATWVGTYLILRYDWCRDGNSACDANPWHSTTAANTAKDVNLGAFIVLVTTLAYGVIDGRVMYRRASQRDGIRASISPVTGGALVGLSGSW